jgi:hypothetical protein
VVHNLIVGDSKEPGSEGHPPTAIRTNMLQGLEENLLRQVLSVCLVPYPEHNISVDPIEMFFI